MAKSARQHVFEGMELLPEGLTRTGGRPATTGTIAGDFALSVGMPDRPAPEGWQWTKITDVARLETGHTPSRKYPEYWGGEVPWIGIKDATNNHGRTIYDTIQHTNELGIANSSARILPANTVCLSRTASVGYVVVMGCPMATSQDFVNWVCSPELDHRFLKYVLLSEHSAFLRFASGTTHQTIYFPEVKAFHVGLPSPAEQRAIAHILGTLDDKIEVNRRMNATLEAMARAVFKDWFVDFGPTHARMEGREPYLAPEIWDLFPDKIDDEGKPEGWTQERIAKHVIAQKGLSYKGAYLTDEANGLPLHNLNSVLEGGGYKNDGLKFYSGGYKPRHIARPGDLIVANTEQGFDHLLIGYSALLPAWVGTEGLFSHHVFKVEPRLTSPFSRVWLHFALSASRFGEAVRRFSNGTTVNMLPPDAFELPEIIVPPIELVRAFDTIVEPMLHKQKDVVGESRTLTQTRDLLLPKLMSGKIRLRDASKSVEGLGDV